ncbi:hypothetical protein QYM36_006066 [Artemia franciscana]|uniref:WWE domain-containing protein n=1 Tax=Artemia franciscana TaxID=6661 RepID=A0AA88HZQ9_ARTSF|nr:hypothetical protein QYM36_006066 [Artemia franciscana]
MLNNIANDYFLGVPTGGKKTKDNQESFCQWFYLTGKDATGEELWNTFSRKDSVILEEAHLEATSGMKTTDVVSVMGSRYDVRISTRLCYPIYWFEEPFPVRRYGTIPECRKIPDDETENVDHLVFLVPGTGSFCDFKRRPFIEVVDDVRKMSSSLLSNIFGNPDTNRVEFLPVNWHDPLHSNIDKILEDVTLRSIPKIRKFANDSLLDALLYMSPVYRQTIVSTVTGELNRIYELFKKRNPGFSGRVSLAGHSLGSVILFDILSHQPETSTRADDVAEDAQLNDSLKGAQQPPIEYPKIEFETENCLLWDHQFQYLS